MSMYEIRGLKTPKRCHFRGLKTPKIGVFRRLKTPKSTRDSISTHVWYHIAENAILKEWLKIFLKTQDFSLPNNKHNASADIFVKI